MSDISVSLSVSQREYVKSLHEGKFEEAGFQRKWAEQIEVLERQSAGGISSTAIRSAVQNGNWDAVERLCPPGVVQWIKSEGLYAESG